MSCVYVCLCMIEWMNDLTCQSHTHTQTGQYVKWWWMSRTLSSSSWWNKFFWTLSMCLFIHHLFIHNTKCNGKCDCEQWTYFFFESILRHSYQLSQTHVTNTDTYTHTHIQQIKQSKTYGWLTLSSINDKKKREKKIQSLQSI